MYGLGEHRGDQAEEVEPGGGYLGPGHRQQGRLHGRGEGEGGIEDSDKYIVAIIDKGRPARFSF